MISDHLNNRLNKNGFPWGAIRNIVSIPFIYGTGIALVFLDIALFIYQSTCFPLYGIPKVKRRDYIQYNRGKMEALNIFDKVNCHYCSYANGLMAYATKVLAETEKMWCPLRHMPKDKFIEPPHHNKFVIRAKRENLEKYYEEYEKELTSKNTKE